MARCDTYRCCYMYSEVSSMKICPSSSPGVLWNHHVLLCYIKAWGLFFWSAVYDEITVHFPLFFLFFSVFWKRGPCWQGFSMSILCGSIPEENTDIESLECCMKCSPEIWQRYFYVWDILSTWPRVKVLCRIWFACFSPFLWKEVPPFDPVSVPRTTMLDSLVVLLALVA